MYDEFIEKLLELYGTDEECEINVLDGYDTVEAPDGTRGFGVYAPEEKTIYVAADIPQADWTVPHTIAHEYAHFLQDVRGKEYDEEEADVFADIAYKRIMVELGNG